MITWPVTLEIVSTVPAAREAQVDLNIPKMPFVCARIVPSSTVSPSASSMHSGTSAGGIESMLATFIGVILPGMNVSATTSEAPTRSPTDLSTVPEMGRIRRTRCCVCGVTFNPGV